ncbi:hypothetical protein BJ138DRAFT_1138330 [Hygrophoropsis aurantiaca]|uniref:Uncharacterized protein n=1 Tax=Hygrophoropsis aurantiaca TaxID=72124 RepID=A0ACB7ZVT8_9AGAM|nr:hypothetical protein BJ138DRAFT_1138330 [Hygrophoropsis aurantiaca]
MTNLRHPSGFGEETVHPSVLRPNSQSFTAPSSTCPVAGIAGSSSQRLLESNNTSVTQLLAKINGIFRLPKPSEQFKICSHNVDIDEDVRPNLPDQRARVEEVEDEESAGWNPSRFAQVFPDEHAAEILRPGETVFEQLKKRQDSDGVGPFGPFADAEEWDLAQWLIKNMNQSATEEFMKLPITRERMQLSFQSNYTFMKAIDKLPTGPEWKCELVTAEGDHEGEDGEVVNEELELWLRDPIACIRELIGNPTFQKHLAYAPEKVFIDQNGMTRQFDEMWTGDWWWNMQDRLPSGATIAPIVLASDKTQLSQFKGDKSAWPVYLTIGNIEKSIRRQPSRHATVLLGYIPVSKLASFDDNSLAGYRLFHYCMKRLLHPLIEAGKHGIEMVCADGMIRRVFPILAAYVGDHPEQCLVACCAENRCPKCLVEHDKRGMNTAAPPRHHTDTLRILQSERIGEYPPEFIADGLRAVYSPFWADLPHTDVFACITSDILHQLHQGVFKDHFAKWCMKLVGKSAFDKRFRAMTRYGGLRHFSKGVSMIKQWTGTEHKEMQRIFLGVIAGAVDGEVLTCARALLDFIYYAQYHSHTDITLQRMQAALDTFHATKDAFIRLGIREHFNIPKLHSLLHYISTIRQLGSLDGFNSENSERLHIDYAKKAYRASSRKDYTIQMARWLQRQEAVVWWNTYLDWRLDRELEKGNLDDTSVNSEDEHSQAHNLSTITSPLADNSNTYRLAKRSPHPNTSVSRLQQQYGATGFLEALTTFLQHSHLSKRRYKPTKHDRFDVYDAAYIQIPGAPHFGATKRQLRIRASPTRTNGPRKPPTVARFDTVLVEENKESRKLGGLNGLCVAEIRVIFSLPPHLGSSAHPLAYVHYFRPLRSWDENLQMYRIERATRNHLPHAGIVSLDKVIRPCHLVPRFGPGAVNPLWLKGEAITEARTFYLNRYIDFHLFEEYSPPL